MRLANGAFSHSASTPSFLATAVNRSTSLPDDLVALGELVRGVAGVRTDLDLPGAADLLGQLRVEICIGTDRGRRRGGGVPAAQRAGAAGRREQQRGDGRGDERELGGDAHRRMTSGVGDERSSRAGGDARDSRASCHVGRIFQHRMTHWNPIETALSSLAAVLSSLAAPYALKTLPSLVVRRRRGVVCSLLGPDRVGALVRGRSRRERYAAARDGDRRFGRSRRERAALGRNHSRAVRRATVRDGM